MVIELLYTREHASLRTFTVPSTSLQLSNCLAACAICLYVS